MRVAMRQLNLSAHVYHCTLKLSRTIAINKARIRPTNPGFDFF